MGHHRAVQILRVYQPLVSFTINERPMAATPSAADAAALQGCILFGMPFTLMLILFVKCFWALWKRIRSNSSRSRRDIVLMAFVCLISGLGTTAFVTNMILVQSAFLGTASLTTSTPFARVSELYSSYEALPIWIPFLVVGWCGNCLMIWRCTVIYRDCGTIARHVVFVVPFMMLLAMIALGSLWALQITGSLNISSQAVMLAARLKLAYFIVALALPTLNTILITFRLLLHRQRIVKAAGNVYGSQYTNVTMVVVESSLLFSSCCILYLVAFSVAADLDTSAVSFVSLQILGMMDIIASLLIIYRVLAGKAWSSRSTVIPSTTLRFADELENYPRDEEPNIESPPLHIVLPKARGTVYSWSRRDPGLWPIFPLSAAFAPARF
ncbi:hypothetical protein BJ138DRAFT_584848 [Hygrophoropsis aurantiaca]|uniref:Uncharacterized protein n=1 Tax=Hygrophoropsis aurantiaca TaxID=72124 RepID=A0ACB8AKW3_9AGAM|nr:hypothetical protein BJ138DRAFT_584848 [Hygrophoropsis aurantiaca]